MRAAIHAAPFAGLEAMAAQAQERLDALRRGGIALLERVESLQDQAKRARQLAEQALEQDVRRLREAQASQAEIDRFVEQNRARAHELAMEAVAAEERVKEQRRRAEEAQRQAEQAAREALAGRLRDPTQGADHYVNLAVARPRWADPAKQTVKIGAHTFFRLELPAPDPEPQTIADAAQTGTGRGAITVASAASAAAAAAPAIQALGNLPPWVAVALVVAGAVVAALAVIARRRDREAAA